MNNISNLGIFTKMKNLINIELVPFWKQFKMRGIEMLELIINSISKIDISANDLISKLV